MNKIEQIIQTATGRLRADPELRLDIANELRAHLQDAIKQAQAGGMGQEESVQDVLESFGDPEILADQLFLANRRRMRLRSVLKWTLRTTLVPAAVLLCFMVLLVAVSTFAAFNVIAGPGVTGHILQLTEHFRYLGGSRDRMGRLSPEQQLVFYGGQGPNLAERGKEIVDKYPDNPIYYANYISMYSLVHRDAIKTANSPEFKELLGELHKGEKLEPDNALYNYIKAAILLQASSQLQDDPEHSYQVIQRNGKEKQIDCQRLLIHDRQMFERGLMEYLKGNSKPYYNTHVLDMLEVRLALLDKPQTFVEYGQQMATAAALLIPDLNLYRQMVMTVSAHTLGLALAER